MTTRCERDVLSRIKAHTTKRIDRLLAACGTDVELSLCQKRKREADKREDRIPQWLVTYLTRRFVALDVVEDVDVKPRRPARSPERQRLFSPPN